MVPDVFDELKPRCAVLTRVAVVRLDVSVLLAQAVSATTGVVDTRVMGLQGDAADPAGVAVASVVFRFIDWSFGFQRLSTTGLAARARGRGDADGYFAARIRGAPA